jgi:hypothetical protein
MSCVSLRAECVTTGGAEGRLTRRLRTVIPSRSGRLGSRVATSGRSPATSASPAVPPNAETSR